MGVLNPSIKSLVEQVEIGDTVEVRRGSHAGQTGVAFSVERLAGMLSFMSSDNVLYKVPIDTVSFTPDHRALQFSPERGYNVRQGDVVMVIRGDHRGASGTVINVNLESKILELAPSESPMVSCVHIVVGTTSHWK